MKKEQIRHSYKAQFETEQGKVVIKDLEQYILQSTNFACGDIPTDSLLREGARLLLNYIYSQSRDRSNINK